MRVLFISYTPPIPTWGGAMAFYRHFVERADFEIAVATNSNSFSFKSPPYPITFFAPSRIVQRLFRTRFLPWLYGLHSLTVAGRTPERLWRAAKEFKPDCIFTVAGSWDYSALIAQEVARRLKVPLVASFNDWFDYGWFPAHPIFRSAIERRFRRFYNDADLALCTCEGMREALGPHHNTHILYPIGSLLPEPAPSFVPLTRNGRRFLVAFAGNLGDWYGPMLERLVRTAESQRTRLEFRFYGDNPTWSGDFHMHACATGMYRGHLPFDQLSAEMGKVDMLLLPMGFEAHCAQVERTSFKGKFLDYLVFQRPIFVWGPLYCSAVRTALEFDSAECCTSAGEVEALAVIERLLADPSRRRALVANARTMYEDRFHPNKIHDGLVRKIQALLAK